MHCFQQNSTEGVQALQRISVHTLLLPYLLLSCVVIAPLSAQQEDFTRLGGDLSHNIPGHNGLQVVAPNIIDDERRMTQLQGFENFHGRLTASEGLGPSFVNDACGGCHVSNSRGHVRLKRRGALNEMVVKLQVPEDQQLGLTSEQINIQQFPDRSLAVASGRRSPHRVRLSWRERRQLRSPRLRINMRGYTRRQIVSSLRMTPPLVGLGLLEAIPAEQILALSDPEDANEDGISGRPNLVLNRESSGLEIGRFGFKAVHPTLRQQTAAASFFDMGVTSDIFPGPSPTPAAPELNDSAMHLLELYQALAGVPMARRQDTRKVSQGRDIFQQIGCADCHHMTFTTASERHPELDNQVIHPFTDLLLHDMGRGLADRVTEGIAQGNEWRTTPLWGLGFTAQVARDAGVKPHYLHDGRARSLNEAILWHKGEASQVRREYQRLGRRQHRALMAFLESL